MNNGQEKTVPHDFFKQLNLSEEVRRRLAELGQMGGRAQEHNPRVTFIRAQSDTLPLPREEKNNA